MTVLGEEVFNEVVKLRAAIGAVKDEVAAVRAQIGELHALPQHLQVGQVRGCLRSLRALLVQLTNDRALWSRDPEIAEQLNRVHQDWQLQRLEQLLEERAARK